MPSKAGLDRAAVIHAAAALADTLGLEEVTLTTLANDLKIRTPSLYNHIEGLPGLRRELALLSLHMLGERLGRSVMGKARDEAILAIGHAYRGFAKEHPGLYMATVYAPAPEDKEIQEAAEEVVQIVLRVVNAYNLQGDEAIHAVRGLRSIVHGFVTLEIAHGFGLPIALDESFQYLLQAFLVGLARPS
jgi:AcrR family transcriptional regulator